MDKMNLRNVAIYTAIYSTISLVLLVLVIYLGFFVGLNGKIITANNWQDAQVQMANNYGAVPGAISPLKDGTYTKSVLALTKMYALPTGNVNVYQYYEDRYQANGLMIPGTRRNIAVFAVFLKTP